MALSELGRAAVSYAQRGWAVFPLRPRAKEPATAHGFKDATTDAAAVEAYWAAHPDANVGVACGAASGGLAVIDLDVHDGADGRASLREWEDENFPLPPTVEAVTGSGGAHLLFQADGECRNASNAAMAVDVRGDGGYIVAPPSVHPSGGRYRWADGRSPEQMEPAKLSGSAARFVEAVRSRKMGEHLDVKQEVGKGGRNEYLFKLGCKLRAQSWEPEIIKSTLEGYNAANVRPPLSQAEMRKIIDSVLSLPEGHSAQYDKAKADAPKPQKRAPFRHNEIARELMDERGACFIDGMPAVRKANGIYECGWRAIDRAVIERRDDATGNDINNVRRYLDSMAPRVEQSDPDLIAFRNGVLDLRTMELRECTGADVIANEVPHDWDPGASSDALYSVLDKISQGDETMLSNLCEIAGLCIYRNASRYAFCPVLLGGGSNGKSTYINLLRFTVGEDNVSSMQPKDIGKRFQAAHVLGKTANLGDDIAGGYLDEESCDVLKKITTGDTLYTDVKGGNGFDFKPYCTMVFSANNFPRLADTSDGMMRRLFPVRFAARFSRSDPGFDPTIGEKLRTEEAARAMLSLAVDGLLRVRSTARLTPNDESAAISSEIMADSDTIVQWLNDMPLNGMELVGMSKAQAYGLYEDWCDRNGYRQTKQGSRKMVARIGTFLGLTLTKSGHVYDENGRKTVKCFEMRR